jgi:hypothetical protein
LSDTASSVIAFACSLARTRSIDLEYTHAIDYAWHWIIFEPLRRISFEYDVTDKTRAFDLIKIASMTACIQTADALD